MINQEDGALRGGRFLVKKHMRSLEWDIQRKILRVIDQRVLPAHLQYLELTNQHEVAHAISDMIVRGAPAIGVAAAYALAMAGWCSVADSVDALQMHLRTAALELQQTRPTAVNLSWAIQRMLNVLENQQGNVTELRQELEAEALHIDEDNFADCLAISRYGAELILDGDIIIHHCNTGALAVVEWGTALGVIRMAHEQGKRVHVLVDETRPRLQGTRLTAWELQQYGIPFEIITDNAAGHFLKSGKANKVIFGADHVVRNGDLANKVGTYMLALAAHANHIPVISAFPTSSVDLTLENGGQIQIEERSQDEVLDIQLHGEQITPVGAQARNPAFDITPHELISAYVTELGIIQPPFEANFKKAIANNRS